MDPRDAIDVGDDRFSVVLRLLSAADGGRPVFNGSRMPWNIGNTSNGGLTLNDASIALAEDVECVDAGDEVLACLHPLNPRFWHHVEAGMSITLHHGVRRVGDAVVLDRGGRSRSC